MQFAFCIIRNRFFRDYIWSTTFANYQMWFLRLLTTEWYDQYVIPPKDLLQAKLRKHNTWNYLFLVPDILTCQKLHGCFFWVAQKHLFFLVLSLRKPDIYVAICRNHLQDICDRNLGIPFLSFLRWYAFRSHLCTQDFFDCFYWYNLHLLFSYSYSKIKLLSYGV